MFSREYQSNFGKECHRLTRHTFISNHLNHSNRKKFLLTSHLDFESTPIIVRKNSTRALEHRYRGLLFPRRLDEKSAAGRVVHWSPYATRRDRFAYPGPGVTDNGFWDTYRTVYPMLTLIYPDKIGSILEGWVNAYREGGWLPKWASPGYRDSMVGTYCDVVLADAIVKGVSGFDVNAAYASMLKDADETPHRFGTGRKYLSEYKNLGFVAKESGTESTSRTLDFAYADFAIAEAARTLGKKNDETRLRMRAKKAYRSVFNSQTKLMGPRSRNRGVENQDGVKWGGAFTEGAPWHHTFSVPYDVDGLVDLYVVVTSTYRARHQPH